MTRAPIRFRHGRDHFAWGTRQQFPGHTELVSRAEAETVLRDLEAKGRQEVLARLHGAMGHRSHGIGHEYSAEPLIRELRRGRVATVAMYRERRTWHALHVDEPIVDLVDLVDDRRPSPPPAQNWFEVRLVDEVGLPISGIALKWTYGSETKVETTNGSGTLRIERPSTGSFASVRIDAEDDLRALLEPRWMKPREGSTPQGEHTTSFPIGTDPGSFKLVAKAPHTIVVLPPRGKLLVELYDKLGRSRLANTNYTIDGPMTLSGTTDADGRLEHTGVWPGDYTLSLRLEGEDFSDEYQTPIVVLASDAYVPQLRMLGALPRSTMIRVRGMLFDKEKSFLLPEAIPNLELVRTVYEDSEPAVLLIVGHTDTTGQPSTNDPLSRDRAAAVSEYLRDDVEAWLRRYDDGPEDSRFGTTEDHAMIEVVTDIEAKPPEQDLVRWYQEIHNARRSEERPALTVNGVAGQETRRELITDYMALDGVSLVDDDPPLDIRVVLHGCGENFPLDATGEELDEAALESQDDALDRRVELFFFDPEFGIRPEPESENSPAGSDAYGEWRRRSVRNDDLWVGLERVDLFLRVEVDDNLEEADEEMFILEDAGGRYRQERMGSEVEREEGSIRVYRFTRVPLRGEYILYVRDSLHGVTMLRSATPADDLYADSQAFAQGTEFRETRGDGMD